MVCTLGRGKMACMVRLLDVGSFPEKSTEEATHEKIAIQTIYRQFCDADEPNLLEEKDMHVFDSRPLTDSLHLVCCNACGKPVKASQFAAHAERCRSINSKEDAALELNGGINRKKPPRKGRKRAQTINGREKQKSDNTTGGNVAASELNLDSQNDMLHSLSGEVQRMAASVGLGTVPDASTVRHGGINCSVSNMPGPLATKIYHSQGSHRLRTALGHLYHQSSAKEHVNDSTCVDLKEEKTMLSSEVPYANRSLHEIHKEDVPQTKDYIGKRRAYPTRPIGGAVLNFLWGPRLPVVILSGNDKEPLSFNIILIYLKTQVQLLAPHNNQLEVLQTLRLAFYTIHVLKEQIYVGRLKMKNTKAHRKS